MAKLYIHHRRVNTAILALECLLGAILISSATAQTRAAFLVLVSIIPSPYESNNDSDDHYRNANDNRSNDCS